MTTSSFAGQVLQAGAATVDLTPQDSVFLFGYPHVERFSTGAHDRLESVALYLRGENGCALFIANDLIFVSKTLAADVRRRISIKTGIPVSSIAVTATHTHSGPITVDYVSNGADPAVPKVDPAYLAFVAESMILAACSAVRTAVPAEIGLAVAQAEGVGSNRHDPKGPEDREVPVLMVRSLAGQEPIACMVAYGMHPTVLHEDSTLISADFPHFTRRYLRTAGLLPENCSILYHSGACGDQSPRHVARANTFAEAQRLGENLGRSIAAAIPAISFQSRLPIETRTAFLPLETRAFPPVELALEKARRAREKFEKLQEEKAARTAVRTAECDWFGAEETVELARAASDGRLSAVVRNCLPAEIQVIILGEWKFVMWPGEFFVEYALAIKARSKNSFVITFANGELQGYVVTPAAAAAELYEATNAVFSPANGQRVVQATLELLK
ncbi:hypothetical protein [Oleiharenicola lentus]|uniref:hypothetical protein n=1 Tax=Oleiharenicola lentus TaxID=2508720 RepID=UPI003F6754E3